MLKMDHLRFFVNLVEPYNYNVLFLSRLRAYKFSLKLKLRAYVNIKRCNTELYFNEVPLINTKEQGYN